MRTVIIFSFLVFGTTIFGQSTRNLDSLTKLLEQVYVADQEPRAAIDSLVRKYGFQSHEVKRHWETIHYSDSQNRITVCHLLDEYGWLSESETSVKASQALYLVIQHSDLATQQKYLPILREAVKRRKAKARHYAYLQDRVNVGLGKFQIYGSQFQNGHLYPVWDEPKVNKRRMAVGLPPLETYAKEMGLSYKVPKKDRYKNKVVIFGIVADKDQKPIEGVSVYFDKTLLATTDSQGEYFAILNKQKNVSGLTFKKSGYKSFSFLLNEDREVYSFMFLLDKE